MLPSYFLNRIRTREQLLREVEKRYGYWENGTLQYTKRGREILAETDILLSMPRPKRYKRMKEWFKWWNTNRREYKRLWQHAKRHGLTPPSTKKGILTIPASNTMRAKKIERKVFTRFAVPKNRDDEIYHKNAKEFCVAENCGTRIYKGQYLLFGNYCRACSSGMTQKTLAVQKARSWRSYFTGWNKKRIKIPQEVVRERMKREIEERRRLM